MKSDSTTVFLNIVLALMVFLGAAFAVVGILHSRQARAIAPSVIQANQKFVMYQSLIADVSAFNNQAKSPEITKALQSLQPKPAANH